MAKVISTRAIRSARLYTADEAAKVVKVSIQCIRKWLREGLPCLRAGRPLLIRGYDLRSWIEARKQAKTRVRLELHDVNRRAKLTPYRRPRLTPLCIVEIRA